MKQDRWRYILPLAGVLFGIWYILTAFFDVVYSDYIRLVNSYLPNVWDLSKFLTPDVLTRVPVTYLGRIINTAFFHYSLRFDQVLGVLGLGVMGAVVTAYGIRRRIAPGWALVLMAVLFSLNKWEMMLNGSGWVHFWAFAGFFYHYLILDRVWSGQGTDRDRKLLLLLPALLILCVAGQYCAVYAAVLLPVYVFRILRDSAVGRRRKAGGAAGERQICRETGKQGAGGAAGERRAGGLTGERKAGGTADKRRDGEAAGRRRPGEYASYLAALLLPFGLYLLSNSFAVEDHAGMQDVPLLTQLADTPGYFVRFLLKSLSSAVVGVNFSESHFSDNLPYLLLGGLLAAAYLLALWFQRRFRLYERTVMPLLLILSGGASHVLILLSRWSFLREDYGMSSRYELQFQAGVLGILLTFALVWKELGERSGAGERGEALPKRRGAAGGKVPGYAAAGVIAVLTAVFLAGAVCDTGQELQIAPYRRELCEKRAQIALDFENRTDDELRENFEYRTQLPESGRAVRNALTILKEQGWNVFYGR